MPWRASSFPRNFSWKGCTECMYIHTYMYIHYVYVIRWTPIFWANMLVSWWCRYHNMKFLHFPGFYLFLQSKIPTIAHKYTITTHTFKTEMRVCLRSWKGPLWQKINLEWCPPVLSRGQCIFSNSRTKS